MTELNSNTSQQYNAPLMNDEARRKIALSATYEIDCLSQLLEKELKQAGDLEIWALRGLAKRISELSCIVMSAIDDGVEDVESLQARFN
jgi:hypothetical protein